MQERTTDLVAGPAEAVRDVLTEILRDGAQKLLATAIEAEVDTYLEQHADHRDADAHRLVVRNGHKDTRQIQTGIGPVAVRQPRVDDRRRDDNGERIRFTSEILPPYLRKTKSIEERIPWLYLKGVGTGDFSEALGALLGPDAPGLSASTVVRLKACWEQDYATWSKRSLADQRYVYLWVDGIHFHIRLEEEKQCILVVMGATAEGKKELIAIQDGFRESEQSWLELLLDLKARGLTQDPELAIGDGALGFWKALPQVFSQTREQRGWVHKTANVLNKLPKSKQSKAKSMRHDIWMASTKAEAEKASDRFETTFEAKYPKATACLTKDREVLLAFYDFPAEHWVHIRTTNPIESTFATVRLRTRRTKGCGSRIACLTMVFRLTQCAERRWRTLNGAKLLADVIRGVSFTDGEKKQAA